MRAERRGCLTCLTYVRDGRKAGSVATWEPIIHSTLLYILLAATISGVGSIFGAALLSLTVASRVVERMVSFSVGVLLATALLHSLPAPPTEFAAGAALGSAVTIDGNLAAAGAPPDDAGANDAGKTGRVSSLPA